MTTVLSLEELRTSPAASLFEGARHGGVEVSVYATLWPADDGPSRHVHPYAEVFVVERGEATFSVGGEERTVRAGHVVVVPPETPHRFRNSGAEPLRVISVHPRGRVEQRNLPE
jgi:mannose-6-phosphate isomerase-like protein (cupin superfamily)